MRRSVALISGLIAGLAAAVPALATPPGVINQYNALCDWRAPTHCVAVDANGAIIVTGAGGGGVVASGKATAAAPAYVEGSNNPVSMDLTGNLRVTATGSAGAGLMLDATGQNILTSVNGPIPTQLPTVSIGGVGIIPSSDAGVGIAPVVTGSVATGQVLKAGPGNLYGLEVTSGAIPGYVMVHDTVAVPSAGAVTPKKCVPLASNSSVSFDWNPPLVMATGISVSFSTTGCFTQTDSATAFISGEAK